MRRGFIADRPERLRLLFQCVAFVPAPSKRLINLNKLLLSPLRTAQFQALLRRSDNIAKFG
ncbi:hypothetical protein CO648_07745 [Rhizobium phaseoli]|nr:hypothetical protein CO648_07745 [Rhizobium phaseoli]